METIQPSQSIQISRNGRLHLALGVAAAAVAIGFAVRAGGTLDLAVAGLMTLVGGFNLVAAWDARTPLLVADPQGVRMRLGRAWVGLPWSDLEEIEHLPRGGWLRDGRLVLLPRDEDALVAGLNASGRRQARLSERFYGAPLVLPLGVTTVVSDGSAGLSSRLADLAQGVTAIVEIEAAVDEDEPVLVPEAAGVPTAASDAESIDSMESTAERPAISVPAPASTQASTPASTVVAERAVIGSTLIAARTSLGLTVDQVSDRTRIRVHILEAMERDDFAACGGDFYARGHLRTVARVLAIDATPLIDVFDERFAEGPAPMAEALESEYAALSGTTGGALRHAAAGRNWSVLIAAVMSIVLLWSVARLVFDGTAEPTPSIGLSSGSAGTTNPYGKTAAKVPVVLTAAGGGAEVVVRDGSGTVVFSDDLAFGQTVTVQAAPPVRVQTSDGSLTVGVDGATGKAVGDTGVPGQRIYAGSHD